MQVFQTAGVPPRRGRIILAIISSTRKSRPALRKSVRENRAGNDANRNRPGMVDDLVKSRKIPESVRERIDRGLPRGVQAKRMRRNAASGLITKSARLRHTYLKSPVFSNSPISASP